MASNAKASNNTVIDTLYVSKDPSQSPFVPMSWDEFANYSKDKLTATTQIERSFGGQSEFQIVPNTAVYIGKTLLRGVIESGQILTNTSFFAEWIDWLVYGMIDYVQLEYATNDVQRISGNAMKELFFNQKRSTEEFEAFKRDALHLDSAQRQANLLTPNLRIPFAIEIPFYWTHNTHLFQPQTYGTVQRIKVQWKPLQNCVFIQGGTIVFTVEPKIVEQNLRYDGIHTELDESTLLTQMTNSETGILTLTKTVHEQVFIKESPLPAGTSTFDIKLDFNSPCQTLALGLLRHEDVTTPNQALPFNWRGWETDTIRILTIEVVVSGGHLKTLFSATENKFDMANNRNNKRPALGPIHFLDWSIHADALTQNDGHLNFAGTSNPTLRVTILVPANEAPFKPHFLLMALSNNFTRNLLGTITKGAQ